MQENEEIEILEWVEVQIHLHRFRFNHSFWIINFSYFSKLTKANKRTQMYIMYIMYIIYILCMCDNIFFPFQSQEVIDNSAANE